MLTAGIDVGFENAKALILKDGEILAQVVVANGREDMGQVIARAWQEALGRAGVPAGALDRTLATGDGRAYATQAQEQASEARCCARGTAWLMPSARTVLDMGAETCMAIRIGKGVPLNIVRNDRCASGTGRSLKMAAKILGLSLEDMGACALLSREEISINNTCAVFAESEIISKIHHKHRLEDIAMAVFRGLARRAHSLLVKVGLEQDLAMVGGLAGNPGMIQALQAELGCQVLVPERPMVVGALGAALIAAEKGGS
ncbi:MAG: acyl-CoA dehydratase activase [Desulfarculaceae bacterium]|nr:acyl-CoA dehydratase activase [Desulfarculaceae bacterium]MCF8071198.1 acyl-CoA dehydratase activase [Desulfarculaceae bacterium]MCF8101199.1 acyl-CoA dehydratase activase [Desulfarculaceae bacterium]MCF8115252.1 acyl-CoA dehydratase activase [Desulfarculaceae bacterium]